MLGASNVVYPENTEILKGNLGFFECKKVVVVRELYAGDKMDVANNLKPPITEDTIRVKLLYMNPYDIECPANVLAWTNFRSALYVENTDRRWFVYWSEAKPNGPDYYAKLHAWLEADGAAIVYRWLLDRDVSDFNPSAPPPMTTAKREAIEASEGDLKASFRERFEEGLKPFHKPLVTVNEVKTHFQRYLDLKISRNLVTIFLRELGAEPLNMGDGSTYYFNPSTGDRRQARLWALKHPAKWRTVDERARGIAFCARDDGTFGDE